MARCNFEAQILRVIYLNMHFLPRRKSLNSPLQRQTY